MQNLKGLVQESYNTQAQHYARNSRMQSGSMTELLRLALPYTPDRPAQILDVGCGTGTIATTLAEGDIIDVQSYLGIDLSHEMIELAKSRGLDSRFRFEQGDAEALPAECSSFSLILSNSALHWLNQPSLGSTPAKAFVEISRCLKSGGLCSLSLAGVGTGRRFNSAYRSVMDQAARNIAGFDNALYLHDPIGCVELFQAVDWTLQANLDVVSARLVYEPVLFESAGDYCETVRAYGYSVFMAAVPPDRRQSVWADICAAFTHAIPPGAYLHDQYMCYVIAQKPEA